MKKYLTVLCLLLALTLCTAPTALAADEPAPTEIRTTADLQAMSADPDGSYVLMNDLDMQGVDWTPIDFRGSFDGNGYAILNLTLSAPGSEHPAAYDGNSISYTPEYVALFGTLQDASVTNLQLLNVRAVVDTDQPCFLAGIAGYMYNSVITDCTVTGCLELRAHDRIFGVGGVAGYGAGSIENCTVDVTLICTDTDSTTRDEQFMGGVYATGFIDVTDCNITIDGWCSEYGYVHNGGIVGMFMQSPLGNMHRGTITGNSVTGRITFFECNSNRRAYCAAYSGETLAWNYSIDRNTEQFTRNEIWTYDTELRPESCANPAYAMEIIPPACGEYGCTRFTCGGCGYSYTDCYTLPEHTPEGWTVTTEPTTEAEGTETAACSGCGMEFTRTVDPLPEPEITEESAALPIWILPIVAALLLLPLLLRRKKK